MKKIIITEQQLNKIVKDTRSETYFETFSGAVQYARESAELKGYEIDENDWWSEISVGLGRPKEGQTHRFTIGLIKNGKPQKKALQIQIYNRGDNVGKRYELTHYIY